MDGLEVQPSTCPQVAPQPDENMYYIGGGALKDSVLDQRLDQASQSQVGSLDRFKPFWTLGGISVICLAVALGIGLGAGVTARYKSRPSG